MFRALCILPALIAALIGSAPASSFASENLAIRLEEANAGLRRLVLDNGVVVLIKEDHSAPVAAVQIWVGTGSIHEEQYLGAGLSHYMEHMIFKGTATRGPTDITVEIDNAGGEINAYTSNDRTVFHTSLPARNWKVGVDVLSDAVMHASLPEEEWAREKEVILREMAMNYDDPDRIVSKLLYQTAYRVHPYQFPIIGHEEIFRTMTRDDLVHFFQRHYVPDNMTVVVVGDFAAADVEQFIRDRFSGFTRKASQPVFVPAEPPQLAPRFARKTGPYQVSRLEWAWHTTALSHPDTPTLDVLSYIVGQGRSSRLVEEIKEKQRLVFSIDAWSYTPKDPGLFGISATFAPEKENEVVKAIEEEVRSWRDKPFTAEEIEKARRTVLVQELSGLQTAEGQANSFASGEFYAGDPRYAEQYVKRVEHVTAEDLTAAVKHYLQPEGRTLVILSPEEKAPDIATPSEATASNAVQKIVLSNGLPLLVREDHRLPFVYFCLVLKGGLLSEDEHNNGITQLMAELLTRGTATRSARDIAATVESLGASFSPFSGNNSFGLMGRALTEDAETVFDLMADCLLNSTFPSDEVDKQRAVQIAAIQRQREEPFFLAMESLKQELFPHHPYRFSAEGTEASVSAIAREDLAAHLKQHVSRNNLVVAVFGDTTAEAARGLAERALASVPDTPVPGLVHDHPEPALPTRMVRHEPKEQAILLVGYPGIDLKDPRMEALEIIQDSLSGLSSDLGIEVREKRGLVYYVGALQRPGIEPGFFALYAGTRAEAAEEVERHMNEQVQRLVTAGLREEEWKRAQEQIVARHFRSLQDNGGLAQTCALNELYGLGYDYTFKKEERIRRTGLDQVRETAASIFLTDRQAVSLLLPEIPGKGDEKAP